MSSIVEESKLTENNIGKWDNWYKDLPDSPSAFRYSETVTYQLAANFLEDCKSVEDWGCGAGGFLNYRKDAIGVDGSDTKFATKKFTDLRNYTSDVEGIHIRHVFEHNYNWKDILKNAIKSAKKKLAITLFIPLNKGETIQRDHNARHGVDVPDLAISEEEFIRIIKSANPQNIQRESFNTGTGYGQEEIIFITF